MDNTIYNPQTPQATFNMAVPRTSLRAAYAKHMINKGLLTEWNNAISGHHDTLPPAPPLPPQIADDGPYHGRVCIIGAGAAGLYTVMMLKFLGATNVDILEATDRVGGRYYTHHFSGGSEYHNYYDVGAMRIPDIPWMHQTLNFIGYPGLESDKQAYVYKNKDAPCSYW